MTKQAVLLVYGGKSDEHEISMLSARNVYEALDRSKYNVKVCYIDKKGKWWLQKNIADDTDSSVELLPKLGQRSFLTIPDNQIISVDVILPILHGQNGEDGTVQGFAKLLDVACAGPSVLSAAVTMDKDMTKRILEREGIPVVPWHTWLVTNDEPSYETITETLGTDIFVKPASAGSSVGVSHVTSSESWSEILQLAAKSSEMVLIEKTIHGREIEVAVLGNETPRVSSPGEVVSGADFYSYQAKYDEASESVVTIPAQLDGDTTEKLREFARKAYEAVEGRGMARVDFFVTDDNNIYLNEINSIPGFTNISMYPKLWQAEGVSYTELLDTIITLAR